MKAITSPVGGRASPPQKRGGGSQDLVGLAQLLDLTPQLGQLGLFVGGQPRTKATVDVGLLDPGAQRLEAHVELAGHPGEHALVSGVLAPSTWTIRTARSLISGGYRRWAGLFPFGVDMTDSFPSETVSTISRAVHFAQRTAALWTKSD